MYTGPWPANCLLVQSFKETLQYYDGWRKFTSVRESVSQSQCKLSGGNDNTPIFCRLLQNVCSKHFSKF